MRDRGDRGTDVPRRDRTPLYDVSDVFVNAAKAHEVHGLGSWRRDSSSSSSRPVASGEGRI